MLQYERLGIQWQSIVFDCGNDDLNRFLIEEAHDYAIQLLAVTYVYEVESDVVAFFSVLNDTLKKTNRLNRKIPNPKRSNTYPAVKIGRFGVVNRYQKEGIGTRTLDYIKGLFVGQNKAGCRFITVDAYNEAPTINFYRKNGFELLSDKDAYEDTRLMYYDLLRLIES